MPVMLSAAAVGGVPLAALLPLALLAVAFITYCIVDVVRGHVRYLPKWAWVLVCACFVPLGGIVYLVVGREER